MDNNADSADVQQTTNGDEESYVIKINTKLRGAMDGAAKRVANILYPDKDLNEVMGKVRGFLYKRFSSELGFNIQLIADKLEEAKGEEPGEGLSKMQIIERLGLAGKYIDFINWDADRIEKSKKRRAFTGEKKGKWLKIPNKDEECKESTETTDEPTQKADDNE